ncbi:hypothetical protein ACWGIV_34045, partial [Streptomyces sp. NPDC054844]
RHLLRPQTRLISLTKPIGAPEPAADRLGPIERARTERSRQADVSHAAALGRARARGRGAGSRAPAVLLQPGRLQESA